MLKISGSTESIMRSEKCGVGVDGDSGDNGGWMINTHLEAQDEHINELIN